MDKTRKTGILMHITSLPSEYGVGDLGESAFAFVDLLEAGKAGLWQMLPLGPTGYGDSPYAARSAFAGNELMISPRSLYIDGYLDISDVMVKAAPSERVDYGSAKTLKMPMLRKAALALLSSKGADRKAFESFAEDESWWLDDYALFQAIADEEGDSRWFSEWPKALRNREEKALEKKRKELKEEIAIYKALQFFFRRQYMKLKEYANSKGVRIIGDIPIFIAPDSSDAWAERRLLLIDEDGQQEASSGVPPDAFSATGQLWGNPLYRWEEHRKTGFDWWIRRFRENLRLFDIVRVDHFRGFEACWTVPKGEDTAINGKWVKSPGQELFDAVRKALGSDLPIIAEDLGVITPEVEALRDSNGFPGMKIAEFGFVWDDDENLSPYDDFMPHNYSRQFVAYTGTHDNDTVRGWYDKLSDKKKHSVREYLSSPDEEIVWAMIKSVMMSNADYAIFPMQDVLEKDSDARMNFPSTCNNLNWAWRMENGEFSDYRIERFSFLSRISGRNGLTAEEYWKEHR